MQTAGHHSAMMIIMPLLILLNPSANRVYAGSAERLVAAELAVLLGADAPPIELVELAGVSYLSVCAEADERVLAALERLSGRLAVYRGEGECLRPVEVFSADCFDDDLVTIPKYPGKTNEQFTRLLVNVTLAAVRRETSPMTILDPMCGRGTTLSTGLTLGHHVAGVDADVEAIEAYATFLRTYLRRKRVKHTLDVRPIRREGRLIGRRLEAEVRPDPDQPALTASVMSGDTRQSAALFGQRRFDAVILDAPYGIVHGARSATGGASGGQGSGGRSRSAAALLEEGLPVWAGQLKRGGAIGVSWNTHLLTRERLVAMTVQAGLEPLNEGPYREFGHRVDASISRDLLVARLPV